MKKVFSCLIGLFLFFFLPEIIFAASFSISSSTKQVSPNSSFTVSVGGDAIGRVNLSVKNGTLSTSSVWVEQNKQTVTVKAGASGSVVVTATPVKGFSDADANEYNPGAKSVTVSIVSNSSNTKPSNPSKPTNPSVNTQKPTVQENKSSNNLLSSLKVDTGTLSPEFQSDVEEYSITYPHDVTVITISGESVDGKATIEGIGEKKLSVGENVLSIVVTAENGAKKTYRIKAFLEELPEVYLNYKNEQIGVLKNTQGVAIPKELEKKEISKDENTIPVYANEHFSIVYGVNSNQEKGFYLFNEETKECDSKITPVQIQNQNFYVADLEELEGFEQSSIEVDQQTVLGYQFEREMDQYFLMNLYNSNGEKVKYLYEKSEGTLQIYSDEALHVYQEYETLKRKYQLQQILFIIILVFFFFSFFFCFFLIKRRKEKQSETLA